MSDVTPQEPVTQDPAANVAPDATTPPAGVAEDASSAAPTPDTGFITYLFPNGDFYVTGDLTDIRPITHPASSNDFRLGAHDVYTFMSNENIINQLNSRISVQQQVQS